MRRNYRKSGVGSFNGVLRNGDSVEAPGYGANEPLGMAAANLRTPWFISLVVLLLLFILIIISIPPPTQPPKDIGAEVPREELNLRE